MAVVRLNATLIVSIEAGSADLWRQSPGRLQATASRLLAELADADIPATWGFRLPAAEAIEPIVAAGHEIAGVVEGHQAARGTLAKALRGQIDSLSALGADVRAVVASDPIDADALGDVLARVGIRAIRFPRSSAKRRAWTALRRFVVPGGRGAEPSDAARPQLLRWGLWGFTPQADLADTSIRALRGLIAAAVRTSGLAHFSIDVERMVRTGDDGRRLIERFREALVRQSPSGEIQRRTMGEVVEHVTAAWRSRPAHSILRRAA